MALPFLTWLEAYPGLAAWMQALGSLAAIGAAYAFSRSEIAHARAELNDARKRDEQARVDSEAKEKRSEAAVKAAIIATLMIATSRLQSSLKVVRTTKNVKLACSSCSKDLRGASELFSRIPTHSIGDEDVVYDIYKSQSVTWGVAITLEELAACYESAREDGSWDTAFPQFLDTLSQSSELVADKARKLIGKFGLQSEGLKAFNPKI